MRYRVRRSSDWRHAPGSARGPRTQDSAVAGWLGPAAEVDCCRCRPDPGRGGGEQDARQPMKEPGLRRKSREPAVDPPSPLAAVARSLARNEPEADTPAAD